MLGDWRRSISFIEGLTRWSDWAASKVPLLLTVFFYNCLVSLYTDSSAKVPSLGVDQTSGLLLTSIAILGCICFSFAFGYALNDFSDREIDRLAGKRLGIARLHPLVALGLIFFLGIAGVLSLSPFLIEPYTLALVLTSYAIAALYSLPPVRLKERAGLGVIASAVGEYALPALVISAVFSNLGWEAALLASSFLAMGLRGELVHQLLDLESDRMAGVKTYAVKHGRAVGLRQVKWLVFPLELALLGVVLAIIVWRIPVFAGALALYCLWLLIWVYLSNGVGRAFSFDGFRRQPLNDFYYIYWPLSLALLLVLHDLRLWPLLALLVLWQSCVLLSAPSTLKRLVLERRLLTRTGPTGDDRLAKVLDGSINPSKD